MNWRFSRNNRSSNNPSGDDKRNDNSRNGRYQRSANRNRHQAQYAEEVHYSTTTEARHEHDTRTIPHSRTPYSYHHSEQESDRTLRGYRISSPYEEETRYMRGFRTYDTYPYADHHSPRQLSNQLRYSYNNVHHYNHNHRTGDQRPGEHREARHNEHRELRYSGEPRYDHHQPQQSTSRQTEQAQASSSNQRGSSAPHLVFPQTNIVRVTYPTKSSLRQPRDDQDTDRIKKKVTFKKRTTTRKISPEPEKKWCNMFRKKKQPITERSPTPAEYLGVNEEREWY